MYEVTKKKCIMHETIQIKLQSIKYLLDTNL